jgi:tetratricopeptide (TPR) repeat protein
MGDLTGQAKALNDLGKVLLSTGDLEQARAQHATALKLASQAGCKNEEAQAYDGLADTYRAAGQEDAARAHWQQALAIYTALAVPEATQVSTKLDEISASVSSTPPLTRSVR